MSTPAESLPPPPRRRGTSKPPRQQLSTAAIVDAAMRIMESEGLDAVSMRRVAQALETGPASLYAHVRNKQDLHELMLDAALRDIPVPQPDPDRWQQQLKELCTELSRLLLNNPGIARISMETLIPTTPGITLSMDAMLGILRAGGVPDRYVFAATDALALYVTAHAYEASLWAGRDAEEAQRRIAELHEYLDSLPAERVPHLIALRSHFQPDDGPDHFEFALDVFIAGLASYANRKT